MELDEILSPEAVAASVAATGQRGVMERLGELLAPQSGIAPDRIVAALMERERIGTTGFGGGTAIPHGRLPGVRGMHAALITLSHPVEWHAVDSAPVDLVFALLGPDTGGASHLKALASVSRATRDQSLMAKLRGARDPGALWALIASRREKAAA
ncbi:PTS sugar transporter subunit IIA [Sandaracinobacteroides sp. A072]|uniref:PTS sugar transporter subunit IIA n=1 Tax=Sandaracinobacteroides sp. A072 TaxID=3461146 RepID=UPI0040429732